MSTASELASNASYFVDRTESNTPGLSYNKDKVTENVRDALKFTHSMIQHRPNVKTKMYQLKNSILRNIIKQKILNNIYNEILEKYNSCRDYLTKLIDNPNMFGDKYQHHAVEKENINQSFKLKAEMSKKDKDIKATEELKFQYIDELKQYERALSR